MNGVELRESGIPILLDAEEMKRQENQVEKNRGKEHHWNGSWREKPDNRRRFKYVTIRRPELKVDGGDNDAG